MPAAADPVTLQRACGVRPSWICEQVLNASHSEDWAKTTDFLLAKPLHIVIVIVVAIAANWLVRRAIKRFAATLEARAIRDGHAAGAEVSLRGHARVRTVEAVLRSTATLVIFGLTALTVLGEIGVELGPLIAGAGIVGIAIGFGAQSLVKDVISGFFMFIEDQYGVGDTIDVGDAVGTVEAVTLRTTRIRDADGTIWHVPNGQILRVGNKSQSTGS